MRTEETCVGWTGEVPRSLAFPVLRAEQTNPTQELWHDVSLQKLLLHCFSPHVPYRRWQLACFIFVSHNIVGKGEEWNRKTYESAFWVLMTGILNGIQARYSCRGENLPPWQSLSVWIFSLLICYVKITSLSITTTNPQDQCKTFALISLSTLSIDKRWAAKIVLAVKLRIKNAAEYLRYSILNHAFSRETFRCHFLFVAASPDGAINYTQKRAKNRFGKKYQKSMRLALNKY